MHKNNLRQQFWIDQNIQRRISQDLVMTWIIGGILVYAFPLTITLLFGLFFAHMPVEELWQSISKMIWMPALTALLVIPIGIRHSIRFSNRIAGPMNRFKTEIRKLLEGEPTAPIRLRKKDFFKDYAEEFNQLAVLIQEYQLNLQQIQSESSDAETGDPELSQLANSTGATSK